MENLETMQTQHQVGSQAAKVRKRVRVPIGKHQADFVSFAGLCEEKEHVALDFRLTAKEGSVTAQDVPLVRMHSECLTGDIFQSGRCDCGEQLNEAIEKFAVQGGVLLYLRQEGRGIGLYNKLDAYALQLEGHDTYKANKMLGLEDDLRDYRVAAQMLKAMKITKVKLLTNNPQKIAQIEKYGIQVQKPVRTGVFVKAENLSYLKAKVDHTGHEISLDSVFDRQVGKTV